MITVVLIRGGGDLASGVALRLHRVGLRVVITELAQPLVVRRSVAFAEAVYSGQATVEGVVARLVDSPQQALELLKLGVIPVLVDPMAEILGRMVEISTPAKIEILVDARMTKRPPETGLQTAGLVIGLGPGFIAGENCHAVIETNRGHDLGRVIWQGPAQADTGLPERMADKQAERVLRAPVEGVFKAQATIGSHLKPQQVVAQVDGQVVRAPFAGILRGLLHDGVHVNMGTKVGDVDPRDDPRYCTQVSDKSLAIGGGVLEAILTRPDLRSRLWD
jgi:xanthine dehydrogenase accessory factor